MASLEEVTYDLARQALADQASIVDGLRSRTAPVVAAAVAVAGLLAKPAVESADDARLAIAVAGFTAGLVAIVAAANVLRSRELGFVIDSLGLYDIAKADSEHPEVYYVKLAGTLRQRRLENESAVATLNSWFSLALGALVVEAFGLALAVAVA
jgi:hypothetical protein